jgi:HAD domain in Swiss Army Knife RNA repair proteins
MERKSTLGKIIKEFSPDIAARIIGATPVLKTKEPPYPKYPRHDEVLAYLRTNDLAESFWVGLDDDASLYPPNCHNLIVCADGFRDAEENALRAALSGLHSSQAWPVQRMFGALKGSVVEEQDIISPSSQAWPD